jgi:Ca2+-binding RTX toxin-like protein
MRMTKAFTYNFPANAINLGSNFTPFTQASLTASQNMTQYTTNAALQQAFNMWSSVVDVSYKPGSSLNNQISFGNWFNALNGSATTLGVTNSPDFNTATNFWIFLNTRNGAIVNSPTTQNWGVYNLAHELGHPLLGAGHPNNGAPTSDLRISIMAYPSYTPTTIGTGGTINVPNPDVKIPLTPGMSDISLLQNGGTNPLNGKVITALGASTISNGNDSYDFAQATLLGVTTGTVKLGTANTLTLNGVALPATPVLPINIAPKDAVMTIYDSNGTDTINAAGVSSSVYINLIEGQFSSIGANKNTAPSGAIGSIGYGVEYNVGIAFGAKIENASGGLVNDYLVGNVQNNTLDGGAGADTLEGGAGDDIYYVDNIGDVVNETATGGLNDKVITSVNYNLPTNVEKLEFTGTAAVNTTGNAQNNTLTGNSGNNSLTGLGGNDILDGGAGIDTSNYGGAAIGYSFTYNAGVITVKDINLTNGDDGIDTLSQIEILHFTDKDMNLNGFDGLRYIASYGDLITAYGTNSAAGLNHYIVAGFNEGRSTSFNGLNYIASYADLMNAFGANAAAGVNHFISSGYTEGRKTSFDAEWYLAKYADIRNAFGTNLDAATTHYIQFGRNDGHVFITSGNDVLTGSAIADKLNGYAGNDTLQGGAGNDILDGGAGKDLLTGGAGKDVFDFNLTTDTSSTNLPAGGNADVISDFSQADLDIIDLATIDANVNLAGNQAFNFIGNDVAFSNIAGQLRFATASNTMFGDVNGDGVADFQVLLTGVTSLQASDFNL